VTVLAILAAACLAWGLCAALVVALADRDGTLHHLLALLHHIGDHRG
jgi:hypothetical protein